MAVGLERVTKDFGEILDDLSLDIHENDFLTLLRTLLSLSGRGKTTTLGITGGTSEARDRTPGQVPRGPNLLEGRSSLTATPRCSSRAKPW